MSNWSRQERKKLKTEKKKIHAKPVNIELKKKLKKEEKRTRKCFFWGKKKENEGQYKHFFVFIDFEF